MSIPPVPYQTPMTDKSGLPSQPWAAWFRQILSTVLSPPAANITGVVQVNQGGTGQITQQAALDAIAGAQSSGKVLRSDGTHTTLSAIQAADVPTLNQNTTGTAAGFSGSLVGDVTGTQSTTAVGKVNGLALPISKTIVGTNASGQIVDASTALLANDTTGVSSNVTGLVAIANGGTGQTTANAALNNLLPSQTANSGKFLTTNGTNSSWATPTGSGATAPTVQRFTTGSGTYTTPTSPAPLYLRVRMVGGGGGASGGGSSGGGSGGNGGNTTFGTTLLVANGGSGATFNSSGGAGGSASLGTGPIGIALTGASGQGCSNANASAINGGNGGSSCLGGAGNGAFNQTIGGSAVANSGSGGGGGGTASGASGAGGGAGGFVDAIITGTLDSTYSYGVGSGGSGGTAGTSGLAGGAGAAGIIEVVEYYQ